MKNFQRLVERYLNHASEYIVIHQDGIIVYANRATCEALELHELQIVGRHYNTFVQPEYHERADIAFDNLINGIEQPRRYYRFVSRTGKSIYVNTKSILFAPDDTPAPWIIFTATDVTQLFSQARVIVDLLPDRERSILTMTMQGKGTKEISAILGIEESTVSTYKRRLKDRLGIDDIDAFLAILQEIIPLDSTTESN